MKKKTGLLMLIVLFTVVSCSADVYQDIIEKKLYFRYTNEEGAYREIIHYPEVKKINFANIPEDGGTGENVGIEYSKYVVDKKNKTISFYNLKEKLIITLKIIKEKKIEVMIVDYGKWLSHEESYDPIDDKTFFLESSVIERFFRGNFMDMKRVYKSKF